ncbi:MAG: putative porin [Acidobacteriota bacterium]
MRRRAGNGLLILLATATVTLVAPLPVAAEGVPQSEDSKRFTFSGDARYRLEDTLNRGKLKNRRRQRLRMRFNATYRIVDHLSIGGRVTTGDPDDPNSAHEDIDDFVDDFPFNVDRLYLSWRLRPDLQVTGGKFAHPFATNPVFGELLWDQDVQPDGVAVRYAPSGAGGRWSAALAAGAYVGLEQGSFDEVRAAVGQASGEVALSRTTALRGAAGLYEYSNLAPDSADGVLRDNSGNATRDTNGDGRPDGFASDFRLLDLILHLRWTAAGRPLWVGGQYIRNLEAAGDEREGWALGASYGRLEEVHDWRLQYQYQRIEQDAVFSPFAQDDFVFQTNYKGHLFGLTYLAIKSVDVRGWALVTEPVRLRDDVPDKHQWRLRLDATLHF